MQDFILTVEEVKVFVGFLLFAGYHKLPAEKLHWSEDEDVGIPIIKTAMSRNRYQKLKTLIHFQDNDLANENKHNCGFKIRPLLNMINESFQKFGIFEENLSIDKLIVKYYGRSGLKHGYCFKFDLYCGKDPEDTARDDLLLGSRVVLNMLNCIEKPENHCVYFDNFFASRDLLIHLRNLSFRATGTVRGNRVGDCPLLSSNELKKTVRGNYDYQRMRNGEVLFVRWHDNRLVTIGTKFDKVEPLGAAMRYSRQASKKTQVQQPAILKSYNAYMGGVDHHDWLVGKYATVIRGKKWYRVLFTRVLEMALVNAWLFYRLVHGKNALDLLDFRLAVTVIYPKLGTGGPNIGRPMEYPSSQLRVIPDISCTDVTYIPGIKSVSEPFRRMMYAVSCCRDSNKMEMAKNCVN
ncbi:piggyBac transposable element-derived protein 3-like [Schistocerca americana]|uniref:piggyBac transposable element-derived protein 3-like n=1 Tax=Schistocerca americana TaxID=7009 RepID=UPI001F4F1EA4|nr:piggyBac transposable element-derived protein 3-like [Schistocerca americana]